MDGNGVYHLSDEGTFNHPTSGSLIFGKSWSNEKQPEQEKDREATLPPGLVLSHALQILLRMSGGAIISFYLFLFPFPYSCSCRCEFPCSSCSALYSPVSFPRQSACRRWPRDHP